MVTYDWTLFEDESWLNRYPEGVAGYEIWKQYAAEGASGLRDLARALAEANEQWPTMTKPCVFISHRQMDVDLALKIAYLACQEGWDYWLDVLDPSLNQLNSFGAKLTLEQKALATAAIIEMALLNSSHVLAVMTINTIGSTWVPYEYGRVKAPVLVSPQAACWVDGLAPSSLPEYLLLGPILDARSELVAWLRSQRPYASQPCCWPGIIPPPLN